MTDAVKSNSPPPAPAPPPRPPSMENFYAKLFSKTVEGDSQLHANGFFLSMSRRHFLKPRVNPMKHLLVEIL